MTYQVYECSPKAKDRIKVEVIDLNDTFVSDHALSKYPFSELKIGQCFTVPFNEAKEQSIRLSSNIQARKQGKKFTVVKHNDLQLIEVARIA